MSEQTMAAERFLEEESREAVIQNLKDAGCSQDIVQSSMTCLDAGNKAEFLRKLEHHRNCLLQKVHEGEKQIGCLDYLVYQIERYGKTR